MAYCSKSNSDVDLEKGEILYEEPGYQFIWLGWGKFDEGLIQTNQYLIINNGKGILLDPGGIHIFPKVVANITNYIDLENIKYIFFTHQDPDVSSGLSMWLSVTEASVYISSLWVRFLPHLGITDLSRIKPIEDSGGTLEHARFIPAHFLHSPGFHTLYDQKSKILFSGDIGAAVFSESEKYLFVDDFDTHVKLMEAFHKRYMASSNACRKFISLIRQLDIEMIAPQHGGVFRGKSVKKFIDWLERLKCGSDIIDEISGM